MKTIIHFVIHYDSCYGTDLSDLGKFSTRIATTIAAIISLQGDDCVLI